MVDTKKSTKADFHDRGQTGGQTDRPIDSRGKKRSKARPHGPERENLSVENNDSTKVSALSTSPPVLQASDGAEIEVPGRLTKSQVEAIQWDYVNGFTPEQIIRVTGAKRATVYKYIAGLEQHPAPPVETQTLTPAADPPASSLSQPQPFSPSAPPPKIVEVSGPTEDDTESTRRGDPEPNSSSEGYLGYGSYEAYRDHESRRPPLPVADSETTAQLLLLFGGDMRRRGFSSFPDYFENFVIPQFARLEYWLAHVPGNSPAEKDRNLKRYLWIATKHFTLQKEFVEYEAAETANNGNGVKEES